MNYFKLSHASDIIQIGHYPQSVKSKDSMDYNVPDYLGKYLLKRLDAAIQYPELVLHSKARLTDLISCVTINLDLVVSEKLRDLLMDGFPGRVDTAPIQVHHKNTAYVYWLIHPYAFDNQLINFTSSEIWREGGGGVKIKQEHVHSYTEYEQLVRTVKLPERISIIKPVLSNPSHSDFIMLRDVSGGIGYYLSEQKMKELEKKDCTGLRFEAM
jgi:hypothetical protein